MIASPVSSSAERPQRASTRAHTIDFIKAHVNGILRRKCLPTYSSSSGSFVVWVRRHRLAHHAKRGRCTPVLSIPHLSAWQCIHSYEGSWTDSGDPYWGGLQMDRGFMASYAPRWLLRKGFANSWTPREQMYVAERAYSAGRGFYPWPRTARICGLI